MFIGKMKINKNLYSSAQLSMIFYQLKIFFKCIPEIYKRNFSIFILILQFCQLIVSICSFMVSLKVYGVGQYSKVYNVCTHYYELISHIKIIYYTSHHHINSNLIQSHIIINRYIIVYYMLKIINDTYTYILTEYPFTGCFF